MTVSTRLEVDLATIPDVVGITPRTVVALPPSDLDSFADEMRIVIDGTEISRAYDPVMEQP